MEGLWTGRWRAKGISLNNPNTVSLRYKTTLVKTDIFNDE